MGLGSIIERLHLAVLLLHFCKLQGLIAGKPEQFPQQHKVNVLISLGLLVLLICFMISASHTIFWLMVFIL